MAHLKPLTREELAECEPLLQAVEQAMGFVPNSMLTMGRRPDILQAFATLARSVLGTGRLPPQLKQLIAFAASCTAGCRYCQAHTGHAAVAAGAEAEKLTAAADFTTSPCFDDAERAALRLAHHAAASPNRVEAPDFAAAAEHFDDEQILEIVAVVSLFGWLNRWNDTLATELESEPASFARQELRANGWELGKHGGAGS